MCGRYSHLVSDPSQNEHEAAVPVGEPPHAGWLVELGASARARQVPAQGKSLRGWGSRRAVARARRQFIEQLFASTAAPAAAKPVEPDAMPIDEPQVEQAAAVPALSMVPDVSMDSEEATAPRLSLVEDLVDEQPALREAAAPAPVEAALPVEPEPAEPEAVEREDEPAEAEVVQEILPPLLARIGAYTAKPRNVSPS